MNKTIFITGAAKRIGKDIALTFSDLGWNIIIHFNSSKQEADELAAKIIADPIEMQRKINNGTKHIMEDIEELSNIVDDLDDGLQLQPPTNEDIRG